MNADIISICYPIQFYEVLSGDWIQGFVHTEQSFSQLSYIPISFILEKHYLTSNAISLKITQVLNISGLFLWRWALATRSLWLRYVCNCLEVVSVVCKVWLHSRGCPCTKKYMDNTNWSQMAIKLKKKNLGTQHIGMWNVNSVRS